VQFGDAVDNYAAILQKLQIGWMSLSELVPIV
jgi:hypothetical protein